MPRSGDNDLRGGGKEEPRETELATACYLSPLTHRGKVRNSVCRHSEGRVLCSACNSFQTRSVRVPSVGQVLLQLPAGGRRDALDHMPKMSEGVTPLTSCTNLMDFNRDPPGHRLMFSVPCVANTHPVDDQVQGHQIPASVLVAEKDGSSAVAIRRGGGEPSVSNKHDAENTEEVY